MPRIALTDQRAGVVILPEDPNAPPETVLPPTAGIEPYGLAVLSDGRLLIADRAGGRIIAVNEDGSDRQDFGTPGSGVGELSAPQGVAVASDGRIAIADTGNRRLALIESIDGDGWETYGSSAAGAQPETPGRFATPTGLAVGPDGTLVVADPGAARIVWLTDLNDGDWITTPAGAVKTPIAVAAWTGQSVLVADITARAIIEISPGSATADETIRHPLLAFPTAVARQDGDVVLVLSPALGALVRVERSNGNWTAAIARRLDSLGFRRPLAILPLP